MESKQDQNTDLFNKMLNIVTKLQVDFGFDDIYQCTYDNIEEKSNQLNAKVTAKLNEWYYKIEPKENSEIDDSESE